MRQIARALAALAVLLALLAGCGERQPSVTPAPDGAAERLPVVATFSIIADMVSRVGGERVAVASLVGPGGDAHTFEPTPADSARLAGAKVVFENGMAFEPWLDDMYAASGSQAARVAVSAGVEPIVADEAAHAGELDPHIWHDVRNAMTMVENIRDGLAAADPAGAEVYRANAAAYLAELKELDAFVQAQADQIPPERRRLVTTHDTFGYYARRYGFEVVGTALGALSTEVADPPASAIAGLVAEIRAAGVPAIFAENVSGTGLMETIAREAEVTLAPPLFTDALSEPGGGADTYIAMMRHNATTIADALRGE